MSFSWNDPHTLHLRKSPKKILSPRTSFTILVPVRNEAEVIGDTLSAMSSLNYPKGLYEVLILCREDDLETLDAIKASARNLNVENIKLLIVGTDVNNKPMALNLGLLKAKNEVIAIFDAEDEPHPDILNVINTIFVQNKIDVIQSGVQLMDYNSKWFSALNVLEYYFWFKSSLHFFSLMGVVPLGGNTVFIKKPLLEEVGGWNEKMLTEDADLGIRLSLRGAQIGIVYDEEHVTKEETPPNIGQFIKQRTRWNQGFLQIFFSFQWLKLSSFKQKLFTAYLLFMPLIQSLWVIYLPLTIFAVFWLSISVGWAMFSLLPAYILFLQLVLYNYGMYEFTKEYRYRYSPLLVFKLFFTFFPYQLLLSTASVRSLIRLVTGEVAWEKTVHFNTHRNPTHAS